MEKLCKRVDYEYSLFVKCMILIWVKFLPFNTKSYKLINRVSVDRSFIDIKDQWDTERKIVRIYFWTLVEK